MRSFLTAALLLATGLQQAHADIVVIVSAQATTPNLTAEQIARIFEGKSNVMTPVDLERASRIRHEFYTKVVGENDARVRGWWSKLVFAGKATAPKELHSGAEVVAAVSADPKLIGYVDRSFVDITVKVIYTVK
jgi:ABC-type phosphate transport system substrate-binding protein